MKAEIEDVGKLMLMRMFGFKREGVTGDRLYDGKWYNINFCPYVIWDIRHEE